MDILHGRHPINTKTINLGGIMSEKVLIFYPFFPSYRKGILESLTGTQNVKVDIMAGTKGRASIDALSTSDVPQLQETSTLRFGPVSLHPRAIKRALSAEYDVVVTAPATLSLSVWTILAARRLLGKSTFLWGQCGEPGARGPKRRAQEALNRLATGLLVYAHKAKAAACELGTSPDKVKVVGNAVEHTSGIETMSAAQVKALAKSRGVGAEPRRTALHLLYVGRITGRKRLDRLIDAVHVLHRRGHAVTASIVGGGTNLEEIREQAAASGLPIEVPGPVYEDEMLAPYFSKATVAVAPDAIGLLAIDSLRHAVPVVFPINPVNGPEFEALSLNINAVSFETLTPEGLADAVEGWLEIAPTINLDEFESVTRDAVNSWKPDKVADRILASILPTPTQATTDLTARP